MRRYVGAVIVAAICFMGGSLMSSTGGTTLARPAGAPASDIAKRKAASVADFAAMGHVIESPRCLNCHPAGGYPTQGDDMHPHSPRIAAGNGRGVPGFTCAQCHGAVNADTASPHIQSVPGNHKWQLAPHEFAWQHRTLAQICRQIRDPARNGHRSLERLHDHLANDDLVGWAWHPGRGRAPAPGTQASFGRITQHWIDTGAACPGDA